MRRVALFIGVPSGDPSGRCRVLVVACGAAGSVMALFSSQIGTVRRHGWPASQPAGPRAALTNAQSGAPWLSCVRSLLPGLRLGARFWAWGVSARKPIPGGAAQVPLEPPAYGRPAGSVSAVISGALIFGACTGGMAIAAGRRVDLAEPEHDALLELLHNPHRTAGHDQAEHDKYREYDHDGCNHRPATPFQAARACHGPSPVTNLQRPGGHWPGKVLLPATPAAAATAGQGSGPRLGWAPTASAGYAALRAP